MGSFLVKNQEFGQCRRCRRTYLSLSFAQRHKVCEACGFHNRLSWTERLDQLVDAGSFVQHDDEVASGNPLSFDGLECALDEAHRVTGLRSAVVAGSGRIARSAAELFFVDFRFLGGTIGGAEGEKICRTFERASELGHPVVGIVSSGGARVQEGLFALMQVPKVVASIGRFRESGHRYVVLLCDPVMGGPMISFVAAADYRIAEPGARIGFAGARVKGQVEETTAEQQLKYGLVNQILGRHEQLSGLARLVRQPYSSLPDTPAVEPNAQFAWFGTIDDMKEEKHYVVTSLAEAPELVAQVDELLAQEWPKCYDGAARALGGGVRLWDRLYELRPEYQLLAVDPLSGQVVACGNSVPILWQQGIQDLPEEGWDWALARGIECAQRGMTCNMVSALGITVSKHLQGQGLSQLILRELRNAVSCAGLTRLIVPVRPVTRPPNSMSFKEFVYSTRPDGLPLDPWIRTHAKFGAEIVKICPRSMTVEGTLSQWLDWEGVQFTKSGTFEIPHLPGRIRVDVEADRATYIEPNVWMVHRL